MSENKKYDYEHIYHITKYILVWGNREKELRMKIRFLESISKKDWAKNYNIENIDDAKKDLENTIEKRKMLEDEFMKAIGVIQNV